MQYRDSNGVEYPVVSGQKIGEDKHVFDFRRLADSGETCVLEAALSTAISKITHYFDSDIKSEGDITQIVINSQRLRQKIEQYFGKKPRILFRGRSDTLFIRMIVPTGVNRGQIQNAISRNTFGSPEWTETEEIVFLNPYNVREERSPFGYSPPFFRHSRSLNMDQCGRPEIEILCNQAIKHGWLEGL